jgi:hypothetical protein
VRILLKSVLLKVIHCLVFIAYLKIKDVLLANSVTLNEYNFGLIFKKKIDL